MHAQKAASVIAAASLGASLVLAAAVLLTSCAGTDAAAAVEADDLTAAPKTLDSFETAASVAAWTEAAWAEATRDANGAALVPHAVAAGATEGKAALAVPVRFDGQGYAQGYVGRAANLSVRGYATLAADVTLPAGAPAGLRARFILFLGPNQSWTEPAASTALVPGATVRVALPLAGAFDPVPERSAYDAVKGYGLKLEGASVSWHGEIGLDRIRLEGLQPATAEDAPRPVGTFGGFVKSGSADVPTSNGLLTFKADMAAALLPFTWPKLGAGGSDFVLGSLRFAVFPDAARAPRFIDWVTVEATAPVLGGSVRTTLSRAFPAVRARTDATWLEWDSRASGRAPARHAAFVLNGQPTIVDLNTGSGSQSLSALGEPWVLIFAGNTAGWGFDAPVLLTFEKRPGTIYSTADGVAFTFSGRAGAVNAMPLDGLRRRSAAETATWTSALPFDVLDRSRRLVPILAAFPIGCTESSALNADGTATFTDRCTFEELSDAWGTKPVHATPLPPTVILAGKNGYPVKYPVTPTETNIATFFGPWAYVEGDSAQFTLPQPAGLTRLPIALRVKNDPVAAKARAELEAAIRNQTPAGPMTDFLDNDDRVAAVLAESAATYLPKSAEAAIALSFATRAIEHGFHDLNLQELTEPVTGQRYFNSAKYWASSEAFDKEWYAGRQLAALAGVAESLDPDVARGVWPKARALYRYDRIFFDWATGSALSSTYGLTALCDGIHFAWEGMLGVARLAKELGDTETYNDAAARSARQQAALFAAWHQAAWSRDLDYAIGHISNAKLAPDQVETRFAIDGWVEEFGAATLELQSLWQNTNYVFFDNVPQFSLYRDLGLDAAVHTLEYDVMPARHPQWADGNAMDAVDGKYYGTQFSAAHLIARALLFHHDPAELLAIYDSSEGTQGSAQWYSMRNLGIAGPTLLAIERAKAPVVEAPIAQAKVASAGYDAATGVTTLQLVGRAAGTASVRYRKPGAAWKTQAVALKAGVTTTVTLK